MFAANSRVSAPGVTSAAATPYIPWRSAHRPTATPSRSVGTRYARAIRRCPTTRWPVPGRSELESATATGRTRRQAPWTAVGSCCSLVVPLPRRSRSANPRTDRRRSCAAGVTTRGAAPGVAYRSRSGRPDRLEHRPQPGERHGREGGQPARVVRVADVQRQVAQAVTGERRRPSRRPRRACRRGSRRARGRGRRRRSRAAPSRSGRGWPGPGRPSAQARAAVAPIATTSSSVASGTLTLIASPQRGRDPARAVALRRDPDRRHPAAGRDAGPARASVVRTSSPANVTDGSRSSRAMTSTDSAYRVTCRSPS